MMIRRPWRILVTAMMVALSLVAAGCADPVEDNPKKAFVDAVRALGEQPGATVTARIVADAGNIASVAAAEGDDIDVEDVEKVLNSSLAVSWHEGDDPDDPEDDQGQVVVNVDGTDAVEVRYDGRDFYLRADVAHLVGLSDDAPSADEAAAFLDELEAGGFDFAHPAYEGRWLHLVGAEQAQSFFEGLAESGGEGGGEEADATDEAERLAAAAQSAFRDLLRDDVDVAHLGADSVGDKVVVSVTVRALGEAFVEVLEAGDLGSGAWGFDPDLLRSELAGAASADQKVELEAWLAGGSLRQVRLDLVALARQFDEHGDVPAELDAVHLDLEFADFRDGVSAPDDAIEVDLFKVMGQAMGGLGSGFGEMPGDGLDWEDEWEDDWEDDWAPLEDEAGREPLEDGSDWSEPGTAPPDWDEGGAVEPQYGEPDWDDMTEEEFDEWMREFERQLEEEAAAN